MAGERLDLGVDGRVLRGVLERFLGRGDCSGVSVLGMGEYLFAYDGYAGYSGVMGHRGDDDGGNWR